MEIEGVLTLVTVGSIVWGGFAFFLIRAIKCERMKKS